MASLLHSALILSPLLLLLAHTQSGVILSKLESQSSINDLTVTLQCFAGPGILGNRTFFRELNNEVERVTDGSENSILLTFKLTPRLEGNYFCQVGNITSNRLELVSYPVLNKTISSTKLASVPLGGEITVPCAYLRGAFEERYDVTWYQGVHQVDTSVMQYNRYEVRRDFSLVIRDMKPGDASNAYYCQVRVNVTNDIMIVRRAPFISVDVLDPITISQPLQEQVVAPNSQARYTCKISGVPEPTIKWTFNGEEISESTNIHIENNTTTLRNIVIVTSTMIYHSSQVSGQVACVGYHMEGERLVVVTSEAHLIVLTNQITPELSVVEEGPRLRVQFPSIIPGQFDIMAHYYYQNRKVLSNKLISHPTFRNTHVVDIAIPADKLPPFRTFMVQVALSVASKTGGRSTISNQITYDNEFPSSTITDIDYLCPEMEDVQPPKSDSPVVALLAVFIVLLIILIAVGIVVGVMFFLCYKRMRSFSLDEASNGGGHFSAASDITNKAAPNVYDEACHSPMSTLQQSRKGSISSHGSQADAESSDDDEGTTNDVGHKKLEQWEEKNKTEPMAMDAMTVDDETGIMMHSNEYHQARVEYHHHKPPRGRGELPYVTNPALLHHYGRENPPIGSGNSKMKSSDSQSSFEDLEDEAEEFKPDAPKTA